MERPIIRLATQASERHVIRLARPRLAPTRAHPGMRKARRSGLAQCWPNQACERPNQTWTDFGPRFLGSVGLSPEMAPAFVAGPLKHPVAPSLLLSPVLPVS